MESTRTRRVDMRVGFESGGRGGRVVSRHRHNGWRRCCLLTCAELGGRLETPAGL